MGSQPASCSACIADWPCQRFIFDKFDKFDGLRLAAARIADWPSDVNTCHAQDSTLPPVCTKKINSPRPEIGKLAPMIPSGRASQVHGRATTLGSQCTAAVPKEKADLAPYPATHMRRHRHLLVPTVFYLYMARRHRAGYLARSRSLCRIRMG